VLSALVAAACARPEAGYSYSAPSAPSAPSGGYGAPAPQYGAPPQQPTVHKHVYVHVPPPEPEVHVPQKQISPQNEEKTLVYVLVKKPEEAPEINIPTPAPTQPSKPEVYFIRYKTQKQQEAGGYPDSGVPQSQYGAPAAPPSSEYGAPSGGSGGSGGY
ncbi:leucine-rich repeat extensin-like protein 5, partial [Asbolus verrucosus]